MKINNSLDTKDLFRTGVFFLVTNALNKVRKREISHHDALIKFIALFMQINTDERLRRKKLNEDIQDDWYECSAECMYLGIRSLMKEMKKINEEIEVKEPIN